MNILKIEVFYIYRKETDIKSTAWHIITELMYLGHQDFSATLLPALTLPNAIWLSEHRLILPVLNFI